MKSYPERADISREELLSIAKLAEIELSETELETLGASLGNTLSHFQTISNIEVNDNNSGSPVQRINNLDSTRNDNINNNQNNNTNNTAPDFEDNYYFVPRVM